MEIKSPKKPMNKFRVGVIFAVSPEKKQVLFFGFGTFLGYFKPEREDVGFLPEEKDVLRLPNPKILLDNGDVIWGYECWWGKEQEIRDFLQQKIDDKYTVYNIKIGELRNG